MNMTMKKLVMVAGLVFAAGAGCKSEFDKAMDEAEAVTNRMCACKDAACVDKMRDEKSALKKRFKDKLKDKPSEDQMKRATSIDERWRSCADKIDKPS
jgi:hypothetical protein